MSKYFSSFLKTSQLGIVAVLTVATLSFGSVAQAASPEVSRGDVVKLTLSNYKFNFTKYFENTKAGRNSNPFDFLDPRNGQVYEAKCGVGAQCAFVDDNFACAAGATVGGVPVLGLYDNLVGSTTYASRGDLALTPKVNYCQKAAISEIFQVRAPKNNANLLPQIFNITNATSNYYNPSLFDNGLCERTPTGEVKMKAEFDQYYNSSNQAIKDSFRGKLGTRNCTPGNDKREVYQFRYVIEYPSNALCNQYYDTDNNGKAAFGTNSAAGEVDCPTYYRDAFGSKFGITSTKGIIATATYHLMLNESSNAYVGWRNVENGFRETATDPVVKSWDGVAAFPLV